MVNYPQKKGGEAMAWQEILPAALLVLGTVWVCRVLYGGKGGPTHCIGCGKCAADGQCILTGKAKFPGKSGGTPDFPVDNR